MVPVITIIIMNLHLQFMFVLNNFCLSSFEALMGKSIFASTRPTRLTNSKNVIMCAIQRSWELIRDIIWKVCRDTGQTI